MSDAPVIRYVVTHISKVLGIRTLAHPAQGYHTYASQEEAQAWIDAALKNNGEERLRSLYGFPLEVRAVQVWPDSFDPKTFYPPNPL